MRVRKYIGFGAGLLFFAAGLSGCGEGQRSDSIVTEEQVTEDTNAANDESDDAAAQDEVLQFEYPGGSYRVESWKMYNNLAEANISAESLSDYGVAWYDADNNYKFMLVTMCRTSTADFNGDFPEKGYVNIFIPITQESIDAAYLPEAAEDTISHLQIEHGYEPVYLDEGQIGQSNYFEIAFPTEGNSITYTLGWFLTDEEYQAGINGELYLWYAMDEAQSTDELQMLSLPLASLS